MTKWLMGATMDAVVAGAALTGALLASAGCASDGALEQVAVSPQCAPEDTVCSELGLDAALAAGAEVPLDVSVQTPGAAATRVALESVRPTVASVDGMRVVGQAEGFTSLLVLGDDGVVLDFVHLWVAQPDGLALHRLDGAVASTEALGETIQLLPGDELVLAAQPHRSGERLSGRLDIEWSSDSAVVALLDEGVGARRRAVARSAGSTTVVASAGDLVAKLKVEVLP
jgi:hypothetical protein